MIQHLIVAMDGPAASGKTTVGSNVAKRLGIKFLDSGRLYRIAAYASEKTGLNIPEVLDNINLKLEKDNFILNGEDVTKFLNSVEIGEKASVMSLDPRLREWVNKMIKELAIEYPIIVTGRDIGTVVLPSADLKIFLDASAEERAMRRFKELKGSKTYEEILDATKKRDARDSGRDIAPCKPATDAVVIDSTSMPIGKVVNQVVGLSKKKLDDAKLSKWWKFSYWVVMTFSRWLFKVEVHGKGNMPKKGPVVVCANHASLLDVFLLGLALSRMGTYLAKAELMRIPLINSAIRAFGAVPVRRGFTTKDTVRAVNHTLSNGGVFCIYPEGTRSHTGKLTGNYMTGAVTFAYRHNAQIVPVGIIGSYDILPYKAKMIRKGKVIINIGESMRLSSKTEPTKETYEAWIRDVMREIAKLSNQEFR